MQIIDKALNQVFKWKSENVTIPEMLDIIETEILEKSSPSDLVKFEKAMRKTWVLAVGGISSFRYYSLNSSPVRLCCQFNIFTHSIQQITLQDTKNKVEYFIPSGKESCKKLQRAVLYRIAQYKEVGMERGRSSGQGGRFLNQHNAPNPMKWVGLSALGIAVAAVALVAVLNWPSISKLFDISLADTPEWVTTVQNGYLGEFTDVTVHDLLDYHRIFFEKEVWDGGTTDSGKRIAEVRFTSQQSSDSATIQFTMLNDEVFKVSAYVDTTMPDAQSSDVIYALTLTYYSQAYDGYKVETISVEEIAPKSYVPQQEPEPSAPSGMLTGTVLWSTDGLRVRSGPGTNYEAIRVLQPGAAVTIIKQQNVNGTYWGNIGEGWVCMDYVDLGGQQSVSANGSTTDVSMTVRVKITVDALRIRSGPDTSYPEVGRFTGGEMLTVTQLQYSGGVQWGRISQGWICMDYVDTVYETQTERNNAQRFAGNWQDQISQRCCLTIEPGEYGIFVIDITWGNSASSTSMWRAVGDYDATADCIRYHDCDHWESVSDGNGNMTNNYYYTGGQGMLYISGGNLFWQDNEENTGSRCSFVKQN